MVWGGQLGVMGPGQGSICPPPPPQHLYTAITRAKNNVIIFDESAAKRAPFYHLLRSLGMARVVTT